MADILTQILMGFEGRITSIEHRLAQMEKAKPAPSHSLDWQKLKPRIAWGLMVAILAALQVPLPQAIKIASSLLSSLPL